MGAEPKPEEASVSALVAAREGATEERAPRVDGAGLLRRTFALDVFAYGVRWRSRLRLTGMGV